MNTQEQIIKYLLDYSEISKKFYAKSSTIPCKKNPQIIVRFTLERKGSKSSSESIAQREAES